MAPEISIVIPVHNGAARLPPLLDALLSQDSTGTDWELIVIDNASTDATSEVVRAHQGNWRSDVPFRMVREPRLGLAYARQRGVDEARGEWVAFLDDDTRPAPDWIRQALAFGKERPRAGAFGGKITVEVPGGAPDGFERLGVYFCERELGDQPRLYRPEILELPPGAGLVVRRDAWQACVPRELMFPNHGGNDLEAELDISCGGWEIWYAPGLKLVHEVQPDRLDWTNLFSMMSAYGREACSLRLIGKRGWSRVETRLRVLAGSAIRMGRLIVMEPLGCLRNKYCRAEFVFWFSNYLGGMLPQTKSQDESAAVPKSPLTSHAAEN